MIFRALGTDNDWTFGKGNENYLRGQDAVAANIRTRLLSFLNNCFFDTNAGVDWILYLGSLNKQDELVLRARVVILQSYGVVSVNSIAFNLNRVTRQGVLTYNINTIYTAQYQENIQVIQNG